MPRMSCSESVKPKKALTNEDHSQSKSMRTYPEEEEESPQRHQSPSQHSKSTQPEKRKAQELEGDNKLVPKPEKRIKKQEEQTLRLVLDTYGGIWRFTSFFERLWKLFADSYRVHWVSSVENVNPAINTRKSIKISYSLSEEESLDALRKEVYRFLQALLFKPPPSHKSKLEEKQDEENSRKIQIPFVKLICFVAWKTRRDLKATITFERPFAVAFAEDSKKYHPSCLVCPKLKKVESTEHLDEALQKTLAHWTAFHWRSSEPGRQFVDKRTVDSKLELTMEEYFIKLQRNIASTEQFIKLLGLQHVKYCFKKSSASSN